MIDSTIFKNKLGIDHRYTLVEGLPSANRYSQISNIYIRDLMFDEIRYLSLYLSKESDLHQLVNSYTDVIKLSGKDGNQIDLSEMELADFHYLVIASSILTDENASWNVNKSCSNCGNDIEAKFHFSSIEFQSDNNIKFPMSLAGTEYNVHPLRVRDKVLLDYNNIIIEGIDKDTLDSLISYAVSLNYDTEEDLKERVIFLMSNPKYTKIIKEINKEMTIKLLPFVHQCSNCETLNYFGYNFDTIRGYL